MDFIDMCLRKAQENIDRIYAIYDEGRHTSSVPDELLYLIKKVIEDQSSALDSVAHKVKERYLKQGGWSPYFPIETDPNRFPYRLNKELPGLASRAPAIGAAFERHQPYHPGKEPLQHVRAIARVNKHRDFTVQVREESTYRAIQMGGQSILTTGSHGTTIGGGPSPPGFAVTEQRSGDVSSMSMVDAVLVDWKFVDPPVSVLSTMMAIQQIVTDATTDIRHIASV